MYCVEEILVFTSKECVCVCVCVVVVVVVVYKIGGGSDYL